MTDRSDEILLQLLELRKDLQSTVVQQIVKVYETLAPTLEQARQVSLRKMHAIEQTANLGVRLALQGKRGPVRCIFLVHMGECWDALAPVYAAMLEAPDFEPIVITIPRILISEEYQVNEEDVHTEMERFGIPHLRLNMDPHNGLDILKALQPDLLFRQQPWDLMIPESYGPGSLNFTRLCYVPYAFMGIQRYEPDEAASQNGSPFQTDLPYHRLCWRIFCETDMHKEMHDKVGTRRGANVVVTGYPKFDQLLERAKSAPPFWPVRDRPDGKRRFRIIWAPHHSITKDWLGFGTFPNMYREMLDWVRRADHIDFVLKPHPHLWGKLANLYKVMTQDEIDAFLAAWKSLPNTALIDGGDYAPLFAASDMMLTDGISFLMEYPLFEKPLVFLDSGHHCEFNKAGETAIQCAHTFSSFAAARDLCERLARGEPDPKASVHKTVIPRLMPYPGQTAQKILETIRVGLAQEMEPGTIHLERQALKAGISR